MVEALRLAHGTLRLPAFLPDATHGVVRTLDADDVAVCGVQGLVMNVYHLMLRPGSSTIKALGGIHRLFGWQGPILTDSGGFQAYSLIRQNPRFGTMTDRGLVFRPEGSERRVNLTPEKSVQLQMSYGADVVVCLDDCTHADEPLEEQRAAVKRTVRWARRCKREYERRLFERRAGSDERPLLLGVVQGGNVPALRRECAEGLLEIGFDGYGLGGWPLDSQGQLLTDIIAYTRELIPPQWPMHALGVGHPEHVVACARMGYGLFDSSLPTRDARRGRLLRMGDPPADLTGPRTGERWVSYLYMQDERHLKSPEPLDPACDCAVCRRYTRAFMHHLFKIGDGLYHRLATIHNLRAMTRLMDALRGSGDDD